jgi:hypothetical protein
MVSRVKEGKSQGVLTSRKQKLTEVTAKGYTRNGRSIKYTTLLGNQPRLKRITKAPPLGEGLANSVAKSV